MRREIGIKYKNKTPPDMRDKIYARDIEEYKVKSGPRQNFLENK